MGDWKQISSWLLLVFLSAFWQSNNIVVAVLQPSKLHAVFIPQLSRPPKNSLTKLWRGKTEVLKRYVDYGGPNSFRWAPRRRCDELTKGTGSSYLTELNRERRIMAGEKRKFGTPSIKSAQGLHISNVDQKLHRTDIETFFDHHYGFGSVCCKLKSHPDDVRRHSGFGSLYFASSFHATSALINFQGARIGDSNIMLDEFYNEWYMSNRGDPKLSYRRVRELLVHFRQPDGTYKFPECDLEPIQLDEIKIN